MEVHELIIIALGISLSFMLILLILSGQIGIYGIGEATKFCQEQGYYGGTYYEYNKQNGYECFNIKTKTICLTENHCEKQKYEETKRYTWKEINEGAWFLMPSIIQFIKTVIKIIIKLIIKFIIIILIIAGLIYLAPTIIGFILGG